MYETYQKVPTQEEFFNKWDSGQLAAASEEMKEFVYNKFKTKCLTMQRDNFTCQNKEKSEDKEGKIVFEPCRFCKNAPFFNLLTRHHIKHQRNGGRHTVRNSVIVCRPSHHAFNAGKYGLSFDYSENLPPHIRGQTFKLHKEDEINWKKVKNDMKALRQDIKSKISDTFKNVPIDKRVWFSLTWEQIFILMRWITIPYEEDEDDD